MIALAVLWSALAVDFALIIAGRGAGLSWTIGPLRIRLHDPSNPIMLAGVVAALLIWLSWSRPRRRGWALAAMVAVVVVAGLAIAPLAERIYPIGDIAVLELYARNALTGKLLVGPYSRFGWHHPGPAYFYAMAPLYAFAGEQPAALAAGAAALAIAAICLVAWSALRTFGPVVAAALLLSIALLIVRVPDLVSSPWNPHVVVLPAIALLVCAAGIAVGDLVLLPASVALSSLIVQTDLALLPMSLAVLVSMAIIGVMVARTHGEAAKAAAVFSVTAWVIAALWLYPAVEQATHSPGNATLLWRFFVRNPGAGQPFEVALPAWATMLAAPILPTLSLAGGGTFVPDAPALSMTVAAVELLGLGLIAVRTTDGRRRSLALVGLLASIVGLWSVTRIADRIMDHEVFWLTAVGVFNLAVLVLSAVESLGHRLPGIRLSRHTAPLLCTLTIWLCAFICVNQLERARDGHLPVTLSMPAASRLSATVRDYLNERHVRKPIVRIGEDVWGVTAGVLLELDRAEVPFAVEDSWMPMFPQAFAANGTEDAELTFSDADVHLKLAERAENVSVGEGASTYIDAVALHP